MKALMGRPIYKHITTFELARFFVLQIAFTFVSATLCLAGPSKTSNTTETKKFRQFEGNWRVSDNSSNVLGGLDIALNENDSSPEGSQIFEFSDSKGKVFIELSPIKKTLRTSEMRGTYSVPADQFEMKELIGESGKFRFGFSPFTTGTSFTGTFFPQSDSVIPQVGFAATRVGGNPLRATIVNRLNFKGKRKAGGSVTVLNQFLSRGKGTTVVGNKVLALVSADGDIDSASILADRSKGILVDTCDTVIVVGERFFAQCQIEYLGPPKKSTNALLAYQIGLADSSAGTTLELSSGLAGNQVDSRNKQVKLKVGGQAKGDDGSGEPKGDGFYTGTWQCSGYGEMVLTHNKNKITAGTFTSESAADAWFPPANGEVGSNIVTLETKSATMKLLQVFGGSTQLDVVLADDNASFSGNAIFAEASGKVAGSAGISCVKM